MFALNMTPKGQKSLNFWDTSIKSTFSILLTGRLSTEELMLSNCGVAEDSWESLGLQGDPTSPSWRRSVLNTPWKGWCWSSNILATWCEELTKDPEAGKDWGQEERRMRWLDRIIDSMDTDLSKLRETGRDGRAWCVSVWSQRLRLDLAAEQQQ